jgi:hypothetical protein
MEWEHLGRKIQYSNRNYTDMGRGETFEDSKSQKMNAATFF